MLTVFSALGLARFAYTLILPTMKEALALSYTEMGLMASTYFVGYLVFALLTSIAAAKVGARLVISVSLAISGLALAATGLVQNFATAVALRTLTGAATAGSYVQAQSLPSAWFGERSRGMATGLVTGGAGLGFVVTGPLVPWILAWDRQMGWRYAWFTLGAMVLVIMLAAALWVRNRPEERGLAPFGEEDAVADGRPAPGPAPLWGSVYRSGLLWCIAAIYLLYGFTNIVFLTFFSAFLVQERGLDAGEAGGMWAVMGTLFVFSGLLWGAISDRVGRKQGLALSLFLLSASIVSFTVFQGLASAYLAAALFGLCIAGAPAIVAAACGDYFGSRLAYPAFGFLTVAFGMGQALGPTTAGYLADSLGSFQTPFFLAAAASLAGGLGSLFLRTPRLSRPPGALGRSGC
jgi:MFS family permease